MNRFLAAAMATIILAASCTEQSPDRFLAPELGAPVVNRDEFKADVRCGLSNSPEGFTYGFILRRRSDGSLQEFSSLPSDGMLRTTVKGLAPEEQYGIRAFASNGRHKVLSEETLFSTESTGPVAVMPDPAFRSLILKRYDRNGDGQISIAEAGNVASLELSTENISSLEGIGFFLNLTHLDISGPGEDDDTRRGKLTSLDLRQNLHLQYVNVYGNNLKELLLPEKNSCLEVLQCSFNNIASLDLSGCTQLKLLYCWRNDLTSLDLSSNPYLEDLRCFQNNLSGGLDLSANKKLKILSCEDDRLNSLDVSGNPLLTEISCFSNHISELDLASNSRLEILRAGNLPDIEILDLSASPYVTSVQIAGDRNLRTVYVHKDVDINSLSIESDSSVHAVIEHKP